MSKEVNKVEYFPHYCRHSRSLLIIDKEFGNNGYALWWRILERLGDTDGHLINLNDPVEYEYLIEQSKISQCDFDKILMKMSNLGMIDKTLYQNNKIVWSDNFISELGEVYRKRKRSAPEKPKGNFTCDNLRHPATTCDNLRQVGIDQNQQTAASRQRREEKSKERVEIIKEPVPSSTGFFDRLSNNAVLNINGQKIEKGFLMMISNAIKDPHDFGLILYRSVQANPDDIKAYLMGGVKKKDFGYLNIPCKDEYDNPQKVSSWIDNLFYKEEVLNA